MREVPFRRIAISALPEYSEGDPDFEDTLVRLVRWVQRALGRGADAILLRQRYSTGFVEDLLGELARLHQELNQPRAYALLVNGASGMAWPVEGFHFPARAAGGHELLKRYYLLGKSCHTLEEGFAAQAAGYDYITLSPIYATQTHPERAPLGLAVLREVCGELSLPVFALGGITEANEAEVRAAGAYGTAAIGWYR